MTRHQKELERADANMEEARDTDREATPPTKSQLDAGELPSSWQKDAASLTLCVRPQPGHHEGNKISRPTSRANKTLRCTN
jgi:hypothetical protein